MDLRSVLLGGVMLLGVCAGQRVDAGSLEISWDACAGCRYVIEQSVDQGQSWTAIADVSVLPVTVQVPENILVLLRMSNTTAFGGTTRRTEGIWYDSRLAQVIVPAPALLRLLGSGAH